MPSTRSTASVQLLLPQQRCGSGMGRGKVEIDGPPSYHFGSSDRCPFTYWMVALSV